MESSSAVGDAKPNSALGSFTDSINALERTPSRSETNFQMWLDRVPLKVASAVDATMHDLQECQR